MSATPICTDAAARMLDPTLTGAVKAVEEVDKSDSMVLRADARAWLSRQARCGGAMHGSTPQSGDAGEMARCEGIDLDFLERINSEDPKIPVDPRDPNQEGSWFSPGCCSGHGGVGRDSAPRPRCREDPASGADRPQEGARGAFWRWRVT